MQSSGYNKNDKAPETSLDHDLVANVPQGGVDFLGRGADQRPDVGPFLRIDCGYEFDGGHLGNVTLVPNVTCNLKGRIQTFVWCNQTVVFSRASGSGDHFAVAGSIFRPADALADGKGPRAETWGG